MRMRNDGLLNSNQRGLALISAMLLLTVVTIFALAMFRSFGLQERIAGNLREKQRALHAAMSAQQHAEWWLSQGDNAASAIVTCDTELNANLNQGQICANGLTSVTNPPLQLDGSDAGVTYNPGNAMTVNTSSAFNTYYKVPRFYIMDLGPSKDGNGEVYKINAVGYGGTESAIAVVESMFVVKSGIVDLGAP